MYYSKDVLPTGRLVSHMRARLIVTYGATASVVLAAATLGVALKLIHDGSSGVNDSVAANQAVMAAQAAPSKTSSATLHDTNTVTVTSSGFWSWALIDRTTGTLSGSDNQSTAQRTASMIKAWLASDYLRLAAEKGTTPSTTQLNTLSIMIRDSDNTAATNTYASVGEEESIARLIDICELTDTEAGINWAKTTVSARDAVRMGACIADGRAAGDTWTDWVLTEMQSVRGSGLFGPIEVLPDEEAEQTAIKNGWVVFDDGNWHVNCLAIAPTWILAVETVYESSLGVDYGEEICRSVTEQLMADPT